VVQSTRRSKWWNAAAPWLLAPWLAAGCASTDAGKSNDLGAFGSSNAEAPSWTDKLTAPFKAGAATVAGTMDNRTATANDSDQLSLSKPANKKNPDLIVALAQMQERAGKFDEAEKQYKKALKYKPKHLGALMGYAHLHDRRNKMDEAVKLYKKAIDAHPKEAAVHNDLGLCYHRRGMLKEAEQTLSKAIELAPDRKLYRNNLAAVMVDQGQTDVALAQLTAAHGPAAGHYNLGYLLAKKGDNGGALAHFQQAAAFDPTLAAAKQWVAKLSPPPVDSVAGAVPSGSPAGNVGPRYTSAPPTDPGTYQPNAPAMGANVNAAASPWASPPTAVRYPDQQTSGYTSTAALPPTPERR